MSTDLKAIQLTVGQVAEATGIVESRIRTVCEEGLLPATRTGQEGMRSKWRISSAVIGDVEGIVEERFAKRKSSTDRYELVVGVNHEGVVCGGAPYRLPNELQEGQILQCRVEALERAKAAGMVQVVVISLHNGFIYPAIDLTKLANDPAKDVPHMHAVTA